MYKSLSEISLENIQNFLNRYTKSSSVNKISPDFKNSGLFQEESQLPDIWLKTRIPIPRNKMFIQWEDRTMKKSKYKTHNYNHYKITNKGKRVSRVATENKTSSVYFPNVPLIIPESELNTGVIRLEKNLPSESLFSVTENKEKEDFLIEGLMDKSWCISLGDKGRIFNYGPMNSTNLHEFLSRLYITLPKEEKEKRNLLVVDFFCDVHYEPDTIYEILHKKIDSEKSLILTTKSKEMNLPLIDPFKSSHSFIPKDFTLVRNIISHSDKENFNPQFQNCSIKSSFSSTADEKSSHYSEEEKNFTFKKNKGKLRHWKNNNKYYQNY